MARSSTPVPTPDDADQAAAAAADSGDVTAQEMTAAAVEAGAPDEVSLDTDAPKKAAPRKTSAVKRAVAAVRGQSSDEESAAAVAAAAEVLGVYESEVASVSDDGTLATTTDGQQYELTGPARGDFIWLKKD